MSIEASVRAMLTDGTTINLVPDARVTHGYRLQDSALPAVTFEVTDDSQAGVVVGSRQVEVEVRSIAVEGVDALAIAAQVRTAAVAGTYSGIQFKAVLFRGTRLEAGEQGEGDESVPAEAVTQLTIFYRE